MSEYPNYPPPMQPYQAYPAPYAPVPPPTSYQPQYPGVVPPQQPMPPPNQGVPHPPKKNHVPSDQRMKIHTIFMFNLAFNLTHDQLLRFCKQYGDISQLIYPLVKPGMAFCTYYDLRSAEKAVKEMYGQKLNGRAVKTNFAYKPPPHSRRDPKELCSTILVKSSKGTESSITFDEIKEVMSAFGELRDSEEVFDDTKIGNGKSAESNSEKKDDNTNNDNNEDQSSKVPIQGQWIVKYYDLRDAQKCVETGMVQYRDEELNLEFILDDDMGDEVTDPPPPPPPRRVRQYMQDQHQHDHYDPQSQMVSPPVAQPPPQSQVPYGYPPQAYPYMSYPYPQVPYGYPPQAYPPIQTMTYPQQPPAQPIPAQIPAPPMQTEIPAPIPAQIPAQVPTQIPTQIAPTQYTRTDQYLQPAQSQISYQAAPQQTIQSTLPPLPPIPPPPAQPQPPAAQPSQPKPPSPIQPPTAIPQIPIPPPQQPAVKPTRSLLSVIDQNDDNSPQEEKIPEEAIPPEQSKGLPSALSSLMGLDSDDTPNDFSNEFDSFDADNSKKNNNNNLSNGHKGSLSFLE